jgi:hypothetical protein
LKLARLDSVGDHDTGFPAGFEIGLFSERNLATKQWTAATEIRLLNGHNGTRRTAIMAVEPAFLSLQRPSGTAQVSGTMDPPKEGPKLLSKFAAPGMNLPRSSFFKHDGPKLRLLLRVMSGWATIQPQHGILIAHTRPDRRPVGNLHFEAESAASPIPASTVRRDP